MANKYLKSLIVTAVALSSSLALADGFANRNVRGTGTYNKFGSGPTSHSLQLFGNGRGKYCIRGGGCGDLYDIEYNSGDADIQGKWNINGSRGTFQWNFNGNEFEGGFRFNQNMQPSETGSIYVPYDGEWKGQLN